MTDRFQEIEVERLILREPNEGHVRAVLECATPRDSDTEVEVSVVRLTLLSPTGEPALVAEVDESDVDELRGELWKRVAWCCRYGRAASFVWALDGEAMNEFMRATSELVEEENPNS